MFSVPALVSYWFSSFLPRPKNMPVGDLDGVCAGFPVTEVSLVPKLHDSGSTMMITIRLKP